MSANNLDPFASVVMEVPLGASKSKKKYITVEEYLKRHIRKQQNKFYVNTRKKAKRRKKNKAARAARAVTDRGRR